MVGRKLAHTLFFDRSNGKRVPKALSLLGIPVKVEYHDAHFPQNAKDDEWLSPVGTWGWTVISQDKSYHKYRAVRLAIVQHNVRVFYLWGAQAPAWEQMRCFLDAYDGILRVLDKRGPPFLYRIDRFGQLTDITDRLR